MNKIIIDGESVVELAVDKDSVCNIKNRNDLNKLSITILDNVTLIINEYSEIDKRDYEINIIQNNNSKFIYNHSFLVNKLYNLNINLELLGDNSKNEINIHGINDVGKSNIVVDGKVDNDTCNNELNESIKILNINNGMSQVLPNMYINTNNVVANHSASVTDIDEDYLFYMNSKGINNVGAKNLIVNGFLNNDAR